MQCKDNVTRGCESPHSYAGATEAPAVVPIHPPTSPGEARLDEASPAVKVPAVVVGGTLNSLGVVRSLASAGIPIYVLDTSREGPAAWSRHARFVRTPSLEGRDLIESLEELARRLGVRPVLILTSDASVRTVSASRHRIEPLYRVSLPTPERVEALIDKDRFQFLAEREQFPVPRGTRVASMADFARMQALAPPLVVKPADKVLVLNGAVERAVVAQTMSEAVDAATRMLRQAPCLIVQEWVEGPDSELFFTLFACDRQSRVLGLFTGRKLVCSPPAVGNTALCVAAPEAADALRAETLRFIERTAYCGLGSLEFKRDARTGRFLIIEPTVGRTDWQEEIATLCGVNLPLMAYRAEVGLAEPVSPRPAGGSVAWRSSRGIQAPRALLAPGLRLIDGYMRWSDPLPALYYYAYERFARRLWLRMTARRRA